MGEIKVSLSARVLLAILVAAYIGYFTHLSLDRRDAMLTSGDYYRIDSATHNTSLGKFMWTNDARFNYWEQHIAPILLFFSAMYLFTDAYWPTFFAQALTMGAAGIPLFLIAARFLRDERLALFAVIVYFSSGMLQMANLYDYHMLSHAPLFFFSAFYAMLRKRWGWYFAFIALLVMCKEDAFIMATMIGFYALVAEREYKKGLASMAFTVGYGLFLFKAAYPMIKGGETYQYMGYYSWLGSSFSEVFVNVLSHPVALFKSLLTNEFRYERWKIFVIEHGLVVPLFSPVGFIMLIPPSLELFLASRSNALGLTHHYPLVAIPVWALATVIAVGNIKTGVDWLSRRAVAPGAWAAVRRPFQALMMSVICVYVVALAYYFAVGGFRTSVLGVKIVLEDAATPALILFTAVALLMILAPPFFMRKAFTGGGARTVFMIFVFMMGARLYHVADYGAAPVFSWWSGYMATIDREHTEKVRETARMIPRGARVVSNVGVMSHIHHHTEAYVGAPAQMPDIEKTGIEYFLVDLKDPQEFIGYQASIAKGLLTSRPYGLVHEDDGVMLFKKGAGKRKDFEVFSRLFATCAVEGTMCKFPSTIGANEPDGSATFGMARVARKGNTPEGHLVYGPYQVLYPGNKKVVFRMKTGGRVDRTIARVDVVNNYGKTVFASMDIAGTDFTKAGQWQDFTLAVDTGPDPVKMVEFRILYLGGASLSVDTTRLEYTYDEYIAALADAPVFE